MEYALWAQSNVICYDSAHLPLSSGSHQRHTCHCPRFQMTVPKGHTPFTEWLWLEYEEFTMSMSILIEDGILTIHSTTCMNDGKPCQECQKLTMKLPITHIQDQMNRDIPESTPYKYLGMRQMVELLQ